MSTNDFLGSTTSNCSPPVQNEPKQVIISKDENGSFGINILGGSDKPYIPGCPGIFVSRVRRADLNGSIHVGDRILAVDGVHVDGKTHAAVVELLKKVNGKCTFTIEPDAERNTILCFSSPAMAAPTGPASNTGIGSIDGGMDGIGTGSGGGSFSGDGGGSLPPSGNDAAGGGLGMRTRNSSTSTITYGTVQQNSLLKTATGRIDESGDCETESLAPSSVAPMMNDDGGLGIGEMEVEMEEEADNDDSSGDAAAFKYNFERASSLLLEALFVSVGTCAVVTFCYLGYKRVKRGHWF